ncbi:MAG: arsenate reductase family protein [Rhizobiaceae bacterium]|nr:arsenate reductase family protein [Rhizobiaceae bacterium]
MTIVIHHNPDCGTSRNTLEIIRQTDEDYVVIEYLKDGWTRPQLLALFAAADLTPREALRTTKSPAEELGLLDDDVSDESIFNAMLEHPVLVNRPIVCSPKGVKLCRPSEEVFSLLGNPPAEFIKEDGEKISSR